MVWKHCDGSTTIAEMAQLLEDELKTPVTDEVVWLALERLRKSHLLREPFVRPSQMQQHIGKTRLHLCFEIPRLLLPRRSIM